MNQEPIIGGSADTTHTSVVALVYQGQQFCTGTIIAPQWVLSAGHCLNEMAQQVGTGFQTQCTVFFGNTVGGSGQSIKVTEAHSPSNWSTSSNGDPLNDVSVWRIASAAPVAAMPWQSSTLADPSGKTVTFVGYGVTNASSQTGNGTRRKVDGVITSMDNMFIYYGNGVSGTCQGDSGGPTLLNGTVIAVTSAGDQSCVQSGENTRVDAYASWIQGYVGTSTTVQPVTVAITAPANNATESPNFTVTATVTSSAGITQADLSIDGAVKKTLTSSPWSFALTNVAVGTHTILVKGTGSDGGTGQASIQVKVESCLSNSDCQTGYQCSSGTCVLQVTTGCTSDANCQSGYQCVSGSCVAKTTTGCVTNSDCHSGYSCVGGTCVAQTATGCGSNNDCQSGYACVAGNCIPEATGCVTNSDCQNGFACVAGNCVLSTASGSGTGAAGAACRQNSDCATGICVDGDTANGFCSQLCTDEHSCPNNASCTAISGRNLCGPTDSAASDSGLNTVRTTGCQAGGSGSPAGAAGLLLVALALVLRRRSA